MTATAVTTMEVKTRATPDERRATIVGGVLIALGAFVLWAFSLNVDGDLDSTFNLSLPGARFENIKWVVNTRLLNLAIAAVLVILGVLRLRRKNLQRTNRILAVGMALFSLSFLAWAAAGKSFSMVGMLRSTVILSVVVILGALTGLMCERVGVINIGIEGQLLASAFVAVLLSSLFGTYIGVLGSMAVGGLLGAFLAWMAIRFRVDQIIVGVVINIFALGLTSFLASRVLADSQDLNVPARITAINIPGLEDIPLLGAMFFDHTFFIYGTFILVAAIHFGLFSTRWGLRSRSVGEHPKAADTVGINVFRTRYRNVILAGLIAGFGGAFLALAQVSRFEENMTGGIGYIGLAAMIFGRWKPIGAVGAGLVFGFARAMQTKVAILGTPIPSEFLLMIPYLATIIVVAGVVGRARPPAADGQPYVKQ